MQFLSLSIAYNCNETAKKNKVCNVRIVWCAWRRERPGKAKNGRNRRGAWSIFPSTFLPRPHLHSSSFLLRCLIYKKTRAPGPYIFEEKHVAQPRHCLNSEILSHLVRGVWGRDCAVALRWVMPIEDGGL